MRLSSRDSSNVNRNEKEGPGNLFDRRSLESNQRPPKIQHDKHEVLVKEGIIHVATREQIQNNDHVH
jgi:hypothetical protein